MRFIRSLITNHPLANIAFVVVILMGSLAYSRMPREQDPEINFNWVNIATTLAGASAEDVERRITNPLEDALRNVRDVRFITSTSRESVSVILVRFRDLPARVFDKRVTDLRREIQNKVNAELPAEALDPVIVEITTSNGFPTAMVVLTGQADDEPLRSTARTVKEDLERIPGVDQVRQFAAMDGRPAVMLSVNKISYTNTNTLELVGRIRDYIDRKNAALADSGLKLVLADDQTVATREALGIMQNNAAIGLLLVLGVCWLFLGARIAALVALGVVFSVTGTFVLLEAVGFTLNVSVLLGIVIVLGMLVDDAVVVVEAAYFRIERGLDALNAVLDALREVGLPVFAAVSTMIAAFLPLMLLPGIVGQFMFVIPFVVTVDLLISLIEAFWIHQLTVS